jgi:hypothetical protein
MALQKQLVPLALNRGTDLGTAEFLRSPDSLAQGLNVEQLKSGEITKRGGFVSLSSAFATPLSAFPTGGSIGVLENAGNAENFSSTYGAQPIRFPGIIRPLIGEVTAELEGLLGLGSDINNMDTYSTSAAITVAVTINSGAEVRIYRFDPDSNSVPSSLSQYAAITGLSSANVKIANGRIFVRSGSTITIYDTNGSSLGVTFSLASATAQWDVETDPLGGFLIAYDDGANVVTRIYSNLTLSASATSTRTNLLRLSCAIRSSTEYYVAAAFTTGIELYRYNSSLSLGSTATYPGFTAGETSWNIALSVPAGGTYALLASEYFTNNDPANRTFVSVRFLYANASTSGNWTAYGNEIKQAALATKACVFGSNQMPYIMLRKRSFDTYGLQHSYLLFQFGTPTGNSSGFVAQIAYGQAHDYISLDSFGNNVLPNFTTLSSVNPATLMVCGLLTRSKSSFTSTPANSVYGLSLLRLRKDTYYQGSKAAKLGNYTLIAANQIYLADPSGINELNFNYYPTQAPAVLSTAAGNVANGTYSYLTVYEALDIAGNLIESSTSVATSYTVSGGPLQVTVECYPVTFTTRTEVRVSLYRTEASGTIYYLVGSNSSFSATSVTVVDNLADATLRQNKVLYTTGGVVENITPPNSNFIAAAKNRLWTFETGNSDTVWFTKEARQGFVPQFSDLLTIPVNPNFGKLVGIAQLDDKVLIFKEFAVLAIFGDGPSDNLIGAWASPVIVAQGIGCVSARSITETQIGVFFQSNEGIYLVDKGLNAVFIGQPVYKADGTILSSTYDPVRNVVFFLTTSRLWAYYATQGAWYEWSSNSAVDIVYEAGTLFLVTPTKVLTQSASVYQDDGSNYEQTIKLGQFQFAGFQGYQRIYRMLISGRKTSDAGSDNILIETFNDNSATANGGTKTIIHTAAITGDKLAIEVRPTQQKCETLELKISQTAATSGLIISSVAAEIGVIGGAGRRAPTGRV